MAVASASLDLRRSEPCAWKKFAQEVQPYFPRDCCAECLNDNSGVSARPGIIRWCQASSQCAAQNCGIVGGVVPRICPPDKNTSQRIPCSAKNTLFSAHPVIARIFMKRDRQQTIRKQSKARLPHCRSAKALAKTSRIRAILRVGLFRNSPTRGNQGWKQIGRIDHLLTHEFQLALRRELLGAILRRNGAPVKIGVWLGGIGGGVRGGSFLRHGSIWQ